MPSSSAFLALISTQLHHMPDVIGSGSLLQPRQVRERAVVERLRRMWHEVIGILRRIAVENRLGESQGLGLGGLGLAASRLDAA